MFDHELEIDLDYELMHKQLLKKYKVSEQITIVVTNSTFLEVGINQTVDVVVNKIEPNLLKKWAKKSFIPISAKIKALQKANVISDRLCENLLVLFGIRNQFAHKPTFSLDECKRIFDSLKKAKISNEFLTKLPDDVIKFQLLFSWCSVHLLKICEKIDFDSVMHLEATEDSEFKVIDDY